METAEAASTAATEDMMMEDDDHHDVGSSQGATTGNFHHFNSTAAIRRSALVTSPATRTLNNLSQQHDDLHYDMSQMEVDAAAVVVLEQSQQQQRHGNDDDETTMTTTKEQQDRLKVETVKTIKKKKETANNDQTNPLSVHLTWAATRVIHANDSIFSILERPVDNNNNNNSNSTDSSMIPVDVYTLTLEQTSAGCKLGATLVNTATIPPITNYTKTMMMMIPNQQPQNPSCAKVKHIKPNSLLAQAGVQAGDVICHAYDGTTVSNTNSASWLTFPTFAQVSTWMKQLASSSLEFPFSFGILRPQQRKHAPSSLQQQPQPAKQDFPTSNDGSVKEQRIVVDNKGNHRQQQQQASNRQAAKSEQTSTSNMPAATTSNTEKQVAPTSNNKSGDDVRNPHANPIVDQYNLPLPFCDACRDGHRTSSRQHHPWCPLHPDFLGSHRERKLRSIVVGVQLACVACQKEYQVGKKVLIKHTCPRQRNNHHHQQQRGESIMVKNPIAVTAAANEFVKKTTTAMVPTTSTNNSDDNGESAKPPFCTACRDGQQKPHHGRHHHQWCPLHPDFAGSHRERRLRTIIAGVELDCMACQIEWQTGEAALMKHACPRQRSVAKGKKNNAASKMAATTNKNVLLLPPSNVANPPLQGQDGSAGSKRKNTQEERASSAKETTEINLPEIMTQQGNVMVAAKGLNSENRTNANESFEQEKVRRAESTLHNNNPPPNLMSPPPPPLESNVQDLVPFCSQCVGNNDRAAEGRPPHHVMCPKHVDFPGSVMEERLQDIRRGMQLGCESCRMEYQDGFVKRQYSSIPAHLEECQRQHESYRRAQQLTAMPGVSHQPLVVVPPVSHQPPPPPNNQPAAQNHDDIDVVPFCRLCNGQSKLSSVHHALCPKNPQFAQSGAKKKLERIQHGIQLGCEVCRDEFQHGGVSKTEAKHNTQCRQYQKQMQQKTQTRKAKRKRDETEDKKGKRTRLTSSGDEKKKHGRERILTSRGRNIRLTERMRASEATLSDVGGGSDNDTENSPFQPEFGRPRPLLGLLVTKDSRQGEHRALKKQEAARLMPKQSASTKLKRGGLKLRLASHDEENEPELMEEYADGTSAQQPEQIMKPHWAPCPNPWGPEGHQEGDVVLFSSSIGLGHPDKVLPSPRYIVNPFALNSCYQATHRTPQEGFHLLQLQRDPMATRPWGFSVYRHDFGSACLVKDVHPLSPAAAAVFAGCTDPTINNDSRLRVDDMLVAINGKLVGGMTEVGVEIELDLCGPVLLLLVSRYKFANEVTGRIAVEEERDLNSIDKSLQDDRLLGWHVIGGLSTTATLVSKLTQQQPANKDESTRVVDTNLAGSNFEQTSDVALNSPRVLDTNLAASNIEQTSDVALNSDVYQQNAKKDEPLVVVEKITMPSSFVQTLENTSTTAKEPVDGSFISQTAHTQTGTNDAGSCENSSRGSDPEADECEEDSQPWMGCVCGQTHPPKLRDFWIQCDTCMSWYHVSSTCVGFTEKEAKSKETYCCWACSDEVDKPTGDSLGKAKELDRQSDSSGTNGNQQIARQPASPQCIHSEQVGPSQSDGQRLESQSNQVAEDIERYEAGTLVMVEPHSWPGVNSQGGIAKVLDSYVDQDGDLLYAVKYIIGRREKDIDKLYVRPHYF